MTDEEFDQVLCDIAAVLTENPAADHIINLPPALAREFEQRGMTIHWD